MGDGSTFRADYKGKGRAQANGDVLTLDLGSVEEGRGAPNGAFQQMQMIEQQVSLVEVMFFFIGGGSCV